MHVYYINRSLLNSHHPMRGNRYKFFNPHFMIFITGWQNAILGPVFQTAFDLPIPATFPTVMPMILRFSPLLFMAIGVTAQGASITSLPFSTDFDSGVTVGPSSTPGNTFYTAGTTSTPPALTAGPDVKMRLVSPAGQNSSAAVQISSTLTSAGFTMSMTFTIAATTGTGNKNVALAFLGDNVGYDLSVNNNYRMNYAIDTGVISFQSNGGTDQFDNAGGSFSNATWTAGADRPTVNDSVTLTLTATYLTPTRLSLSGTASTNAGAAPVNISAVMETAAIAYTGTNFGVRSGSAASNSSTIDVTNFSVDVIPEPTSAALVTLAAGAFFLRRKRS